MMNSFAADVLNYIDNNQSHNIINQHSLNVELLNKYRINCNNKMGDIYAEQGKDGEALERYEEAARFDKSEFSARNLQMQQNYIRGKESLTSENYSEAVSAFSNATILAEQNEKSSTTKSKLYSSLGTAHYHHASRTEAKEGVDLEAFKEEQFTLAVANCSTALDLNPDDKDALATRAYANDKLGNKQDVIRDCQIAIPKYPKESSDFRSLISTHTGEYPSSDEEGHEETKDTVQDDPSATHHTEETKKSQSTTRKVG